MEHHPSEPAGLTPLSASSTDDVSSGATTGGLTTGDPTVSDTENAGADQAPGLAAASEATEGAAAGDLEGRVVEAIQTIFDPEIPVNIYELGLIYSVLPADNGHVDVQMTLTSPHCPVAESLPGEVRHKVESVSGVSSAAVDVVWDPPWNPDMMSEAAKLELGMF